jgi:chromosome segregation ATPase
MSKPAMRLVGDAPPRTPEREGLAAAQDRHGAARERLAAIKTAQERAFDSVLNLKDAASAAAAALEQAKADEPRQLVESFIGGDTAEVASLVKAAAAAIEEADTRLASARQMRDALDQEEKAAEREVMWAKGKLDDAVRTAVKADPATARLVAAFNEAERVYVSLRQAMGVVGTGRLPKGSEFWDCQHNWPALADGSQWKAAIALLETDADAPLPS